LLHREEENFKEPYLKKPSKQVAEGGWEKAKLDPLKSEIVLQTRGKDVWVNG